MKYVLWALGIVVAGIAIAFLITFIATVANYLITLPGGRLLRGLFGVFVLVICMAPILYYVDHRRNHQ